MSHFDREFDDTLKRLQEDRLMASWNRGYDACRKATRGDFLYVFFMGAVFGAFCVGIVLSLTEGGS